MIRRGRRRDQGCSVREYKGGHAMPDPWRPVERRRDGPELVFAGRGRAKGDELVRDAEVAPAGER